MVIAEPRSATVAADGSVLVRSWWQRARVWVIVLAVVIVGGAVIAAVAGSTSRPLDPASTADDGSRALADVLRTYGARLTPVSSVEDSVAARSDVLVVLDPDAYSDAQLQRLVAVAKRVVLVQPGVRALQAVSTAEPDTGLAVDTDPHCAVPAATAAGTLDVPSDATAYTGGGCYGGLVVFPAGNGRLVVLGSSQLLQNDHLAGLGVAALDVNLLTVDRTARSVTWLSVGADAAGSGSASVWDLFPAAVYRAFLWLLLIGVLVVLWRSSRLGPPVVEPLPVIVRAAELVEGHGRLYRRAGALDRAAAALRTATVTRLTARLGLPRGASALQVGAAAGPIAGRTPGDVHAVLAGDVPSDDAGLVRLGQALVMLEADVRGGGTTTERTSTL